jgi:acetyl-CoA carboxylase biotin carboxyl carrier protein
VIELEFLEGLIRALDESSLDSVEIDRGGTRIRLSKTAPPASVVSEGGTAPDASPPAAVQEAGSSPEVAEEPDSSNLVDVKSPMVGTFYRSAAPDAPSYVERGTRVSKGDTLCIIEAMKLMNELESEVDGMIAEICIDNAVPIEFGQVLFRIDPGP